MAVQKTHFLLTKKNNQIAKRKLNLRKMKFKFNWKCSL